MRALQTEAYKIFVRRVDLNIPRLAGDKAIDFGVTPDYEGLHKNYLNTIQMALWSDGELKDPSTFMYMLSVFVCCM